MQKYIQDEDAIEDARVENSINVKARFRPVNKSATGSPGKNTLDEGGNEGVPLGSHNLAGSIQRVGRLLKAASDNNYQKILRTAQDSDTASFVKPWNAHQLRDNWGGLGTYENVTHWSEDYETGDWNGGVEKRLDGIRKEVSIRNLDQPPRSAPVPKAWNNRHRLEVQYNVEYKKHDDIRAGLPKLNTLNVADQNNLIKLMSFLPVKSSYKFLTSKVDDKETLETRETKEKVHSMINT
ncbi:hypothetical protein [Algicola sagamiensis]|uniref:hypothetical protein n=1 Tax=Algicola sagamiensis TaxID=163869 RepID=UPI00035E8FF5|nr:hypothetical protein [Algicola sagamiensis]